MAKPILVANWKNHPKSLTEAKALLRQLSRDSQSFKKVSLFIASPLPYLQSVAERARGPINTASQDMSPTLQGTHTGTVTPDILKSFGVRLSIIGHSERRALGDTNESVAEKVRVALRSGITPLVCIGEASRDQDGEHFEFLREELKFSLAGCKKSDASKIMIAYEPMWAIGKHAQDAMTPDDLAQSVIFIRKILTDIFGRKAAESVPILYGGSVEPADAKALYKGTGVAGFLVGHASLNTKNFKMIAQELTSK